MIKPSLATLCLVLAPVTAVAHGRLHEDLPNPIAGNHEPNGDWEFTLSPYVWACNFDGDIGVGPVVADIDLPINEALDYLDAANFVSFEVRNGPWAMNFDVLWLGLEANIPTNSILFGDALLDLELIRSSSQIGYRVLDGSNSLDLFAGINTFHFSSTINVDPGLLPGGNLNIGDDWWDPVVATRLITHWNERWFGLLHTALGGFGAGSDISWQAMTGCGIIINDHSSAFIGYRHLFIDYRSDTFLYKVNTSGLILGVNLSF